MTAETIDPQAVRVGLIRRRKELIRSEQWFPFREELHCLAEPSFDAVLVNLTDSEILDISDDDAIFIHEYDEDEEGVPLNGTFLIGIMADLDLFHSAPETTADDVKPQDKSKASTRGRPPANWWPDAFAQFGVMMIDEEYEVPQNTMTNRVMDRLAERGIEASRTTLQPAISKFYAELRASRK